MSKKKMIELNIEPFDLSKCHFLHRSETKPITFWVPLEIKAKYDELQKMTKKQFGKHMLESVAEAIDMVVID